jgi:hypothetical protein
MSDVPVVRSTVHDPKSALPKAKPLDSAPKTPLPKAKPLTTDELAALVPATIPHEPKENGTLPQAKPLSPEELESLAPPKSHDSGIRTGDSSVKTSGSGSSTTLPQAKPLPANDPYARRPSPPPSAVDLEALANWPPAETTDQVEWPTTDIPADQESSEPAPRWEDEVESITIRVRAISALAVAGVGIQFSTAIAAAAHFFITESPAWAISMILHAVAVVTMAMVTATPAIPKQQQPHLTVTPPEEEDVVERLVDQGIEQFDDRLLNDLDEAPRLDESLADETSAEGQEELQPQDMEEADATDPDADIGDFVFGDIPKSDLLSTAGLYSGSTVSVRNNAAMKAMIAQREGATGASEQTVKDALRWLALHQMDDGGWSFDHNQCRGCRGQCRNEGTFGRARNAATAMALLPFLGAGYTHQAGPYKQTIRIGLAFLVSHMRENPQGRGMSLIDKEGRMYAHGLGAIALCESYAMTHDKALKEPAQQALDFICWAQDPQGGGWRYVPRDRGDTSVVGWQLMALKSGCMANLNVSKSTIRKVNGFLDRVQKNNGAGYVYFDRTEIAKPATTAIGLLCRMYLGWKKDNPALQEGVRSLCLAGPSGSNFYYNYYATQVLRHREGEEWNRWNRMMRDQLVHGQAKVGHEKGSWYFSGDNGSAPGGRLYCTAMAAMILEVYYRHMPLYRSDSVEREFPE